MSLYLVHENTPIPDDDEALIETLDPKGTGRIELIGKWTGGMASTAAGGARGISSVETMKRAEGRTGLSNQGATCYLNSLIQTLYMTPEFRRTLYEWSFDESTRKEFIQKIKERDNKKNQQQHSGDDSTDDISIDEDLETEQIEIEFDLQTEERFLKYKEKKEPTSIARQLQLLFAALQLAEGRSASTKPLTTSFGWTKGEAFTQHDVQELCRVLFDALEKVWQGTERANLINELYQGAMKDYVRCTECGHESSRNDYFLDIPLVIKGFGETKAVGSIEEALGKFTDIERLNGDNQYFCESCDRKVDADKGLSFTDFPYFLMLQLKRFDFDYMTMRRVKLNDRVSFPEILDMNLYLEGNEELRKSKGIIPEYSFGNDTKRSEILQEALSHGPHVYELFSVLIHSGSAMGGHYYAYIKSLDKNEWYNFNDSSVTHLSAKSVETTFGSNTSSESRMGGAGGMAGMMGMGRGTSGTNAYMLVYRKYDPMKNQPEPSEDAISGDLRMAVEELKKKLAEDISGGSDARHMARVNLHYGNNKKEGVSFSRNEPIQKILEVAIEEFKLQEIDPSNIRMREYNAHFEIPGIIFTNMEKTLEDLRKYHVSIVIETKNPDEEFEDYDPNKMRIKVSYWNEETQKFDGPDIIAIEKSDTLGDLRAQLAEKYPHIPYDLQLISKGDFNRYNAVLLKNDQKSLRLNLKIYEGVQIFLEPMLPNTTEDDYIYNYHKTVGNEGDTVFPRAFEEITILKNSIKINFTDLDGEDFKHSVNISKHKTLEDLKIAMGELIGADPNEFKVMKGLSTYRHELRSTEKRLFECHIANNEKLALVKGAPLGKNEGIFKMNLFYYSDTEWEIIELFESSFDNNLTIEEVAPLFLEKFHEWKANPVDPEKPFNEKYDLGNDPTRLRFRIMTAGYPSDVLIPAKNTMKKASRNLVYSTPQLSVELLPEGEEEGKDDTNVQIFVQQFYPETYELGKKMSFYVNQTQLISDLRAEITEKTGCESISLSACEKWDMFNILDLPEFAWYKPPDPNKPTYTALRNVRSLRPRDGHVMIFKDSTAELGKLTEDQKKALLEKYKSHKPQRQGVVRGTYKEKQLKINQDDIDIDDFFDNEDNLEIKETDAGIEENQ